MLARRRLGVPCRRVMADEGPIRSEFADDPEMTLLIREFVESLPARAGAIHAHLEAGAHDTARTLAHQLKGAGGGYGFPQVTEAARAVDRSIRDRRLDDARAAASALIKLAARVVP